MLFDLNLQFDRELFEKRSKHVLDKRLKIELTVKRELKSLSQWGYLHVCYNMYAIYVGESLEIAKIHLKLECPFMHETYRKYVRLISTTEISDDTKKMTDWIEWIRNYASMNGVFIPSPDDYRRNWMQYENEIEACKPYM
jgi:hypothetical protein